MRAKIRLVPPVQQPMSRTRLPVRSHGRAENWSMNMLIKYVDRFWDIPFVEGSELVDPSSEIGRRNAYEVRRLKRGLQPRDVAE